MYVENTVVNRGTDSVLSHYGKVGEAFFTHYNLSCSDGVYAKNEPIKTWDGICNISNERLIWNDWEW